MSGVYIKGMAMPTDCIHCRFRGFGGIQNEKVVCSFTGRNAFINTVERFDDCPLVPVPDHGRLIDADALEDYAIALKRDAIHAYEWTGKSGEWNARATERGRFVVMIEDAPTIIPADKDGADNV